MLQLVARLFLMCAVLLQLQLQLLDILNPSLASSHFTYLLTWSCYAADCRSSIAIVMASVDPRDDQLFWPAGVSVSCRRFRVWKWSITRRLCGMTREIVGNTCAPGSSTRRDAEDN